MRRLWEVLEPAKEGDRLSRTFDIVILSLIALNVVASVVGTVDSVEQRFGPFLAVFAHISLVVFCVEYFLRLAACTVDPRFAGALRGRLRFARTPLAFVDLVAILPFVLSVGADMRCLRVLRLLRILSLAKLARYVETLELLRRVFRERREELVVTTGIMGMLLVISASLMFQVEHAVQPEGFPNIPETMWWAVVTLTTVGYGDVSPVTPVGKLLGALVAILGIGFFALPAGILGSGFVEEVHKRRFRCPHCGKSVHDTEDLRRSDASGGHRSASE